MTHAKHWPAKMATSSTASAIKYKFIIEPNDELKCLICHSIARDPLQHEVCGKLFCKVCLEKFGKGKPCPNCRDTKSNYYVDKKSKFATNKNALNGHH